MDGSGGGRWAEKVRTIRTNSTRPAGYAAFPSPELGRRGPDRRPLTAASRSAPRHAGAGSWSSGLGPYPVPGYELGSLFDVPGRGARVAIRRGRNARLVAARPTARRRALGPATPDASGGSVLELLAHAIELGRVLGTEPAARKGRLLTMTSTTTTHRSLRIADANARSTRRARRRPRGSPSTLLVCCRFSRLRQSLRAAVAADRA